MLLAKLGQEHLFFTGPEQFLLAIGQRASAKSSPASLSKILDPPPQQDTFTCAKQTSIHGNLLASSPLQIERIQFLPGIVCSFAHQ